MDIQLGKACDILQKKEYVYQFLCSIEVVLLLESIKS